MQPTKPIAGCLGCGCFAPIVIAVILLGGMGAVFGNWATYGASPVSLASGQNPALAGIPPDYVGFYGKAAQQFGLDWQVLAAVGEVESDHGMEYVDCAKGPDGGKGPMQFDDATWSSARSLANLPSDADVCDPETSILGLAALMRSSGAPADWTTALRAKNPASWYPAYVMSWAIAYGDGSSVVWPITGGGRLTQKFGPTDYTSEPSGCYHGVCYPHFHDGVDLAAPEGTDIHAIAAGKVTYAGAGSDGAVVVQIDHGNGVVSEYGHLEPNLDVAAGDSVTIGYVIGHVGMTGDTTGPHLHFTVMIDRQLVDPQLILPLDSSVSLYTTPHIRVWSEMPELSLVVDGQHVNKGVDCPEGAYLSALLAAGLPSSDFELGVDTPQERERFEHAHPAGTVLDIGDIGFKNDDYSSEALYGVQLHTAARADLAHLLSTPGMIVVIGGEGDGLPSGITVPHATAYEVLADATGQTKVVVADPMRRAGAYPEAMPANAIEIITTRLDRLLVDGGSTDYRMTNIRYAMDNEFANLNPSGQ
jgi:hypothetical protein